MPLHNMIPRIQRISAGAESLLPFAQKKFKQFERLRLSTGGAVLQKTFLIAWESSFATVKIYTSSWDNYIAIDAGASVQALIAISRPTGDSDGVLSGFDYYTRKFNTLITSDVIADSEIYPAYDSLLVYSDGVVSDGQAQYALSSTDWFSNAEPVVNINDGKVSLLAQGNQLYGVLGHNSWLVHTFSSDIEAELCGLTPQGSFIITQPHEGADWNGAYGVDAFTLSGLSSKDMAFTWVPNFYAIYPGNGMGLRSGWYYGERYNSAYGAIDPLNSAEVYFKGVATNRQESPSLYAYGRFETVGSYEVDYGDDGEQTVCDLFAYFDASPPTTYSNSTEYYQYGMTISMDIATVTCGDGGKGDKPTFWVSLDPTKYNAASLKVDSVVIDVVKSDGALSLSGYFGGIFVIASSGSHASLYKFTGYLSKVYETSRYKAHSFSNDGKTLAIFEGSEAIDTVVVYDLYGKRQKLQDAQDADEWVDPTYAAGDSYSGPGTTPLCNEPVPEQYRGQYGVIIPHAIEGVETERTEQPPTITNSVNDDRPYLPCQSIIKFATDGQGGFYSEKILIEDGIKATLIKGGDECMTNTVIVEGGSVEQSHLVATTDRFGPHDGQFRIRGRFDNPEFGPLLMEGEGTPGYTITMPDTFAWYFTTGSAVLYVPRYSGDLIPGNCTSIDEHGNVIFDRESGDCCRDGNGEVTVEVATSCGQSSVRQHWVVAMALNGPTENDVVSVGENFGAVNGVPPYSWQASGISISISGERNQTATVTSINDCEPGELLIGSITVTDKCGESITREFRLEGGSWTGVGYEFSYSSLSSSVIDIPECGVLVDARDYGWDRTTYNTPATRTLYDGYTRYDETAGWTYSRSIDVNAGGCGSTTWKERDLSGKCGYIDAEVESSIYYDGLHCCVSVTRVLCVWRRYVYVWTCP